MLLKQESNTSQKHGSWKFWQITNTVLSKGELTIPPLFKGPRLLCSESDKAKLFMKYFCNNSNVDDSGISLPVFPSKTNL